MAAVCWRNDGKVTQVGGKAGGSGHTTAYIGKAHRPKPQASGDTRPTATAYPTPEAAFRACYVPGGKLVATWKYPGDLARVGRWDVPGEPKQCRPIHRTDAGWIIGDPPGLWPIYRGDELPATGTVWVSEGEKATDAARGLRLSATTSAHGSSSADKSDWTPLAGRDVVILPDHDEPGRKYAHDVVKILMRLDPPARVKIVALPGLPDGGDIVEYIADYPGDKPKEIAERIIALADAMPWLDAVDVEPVEPWPDPQALPAGLPAVMPFDFALLPNALHDWIADISARMQCPPDYCAATAMVMAGAMIGRKVAIRPKRRDDWQVVANLYGMNVGRPSLMKTPAMKEVLKYLSRLEVEAKQEYAKAMEEHETAMAVADATKRVRKSELAQAVKDGKDADIIAQAAKAMAGAEADEPTRRRYMVNDTTVEKLGMILAENPNGILIFGDELASFLRSMDREGHEADRGFYLMAWAGDSRYTYDRIGRGTLDIEAAIVSIVGSIQPGVIADYLRGAVAGGGGDDGLIQRFQLTVWPDAPKAWVNVDRYPDADAKAKASAALERLDKLMAGDVQAERDNFDRDALPFIRFDPAAQDAFDAWRLELETRLRAGDLHPAVESHLAKYRSLIPSLALILHLLDGGIGPVTLPAIEKAIGWGGYLESHARRLYSSVTEAPAVAAHLLAARIQAGDLSNPFAARDIYRNGWAGLDRDRTEAAIDVLLALHWLEERIEPAAHKTRTRFAINPKIQISLRDEPTKPTKPPSVSFVSDTSKDILFFDDSHGDGRERGEL
jgi:putative DNA primase/helicase